MMDTQAQSTPERLELTPEQATREISKRAIVTAAQYGRRVMIGIAGGPGSGKSTMTADVIRELNTRIDGSAARLPMDGFHRRHADLVAAGLDKIKGAPETFDVHAFVHFATKAKAAKTPIAAPSYSRRIEDVVEDAFTIAGNVPILIVEGNYLLLDAPAWRPLRDQLDYAIFLRVPRDKVYKRLIARRAEHGLFAKNDIVPHVDNVDMPNYDAVNATIGRADLTIDLITDS